MAGPNLPAQPEPSRSLTPVPFRRMMHPIDEITTLLETIHALAVRQGVTEEVMAAWEIGMLRICNGYDNQRALSSLPFDVIQAFLGEVSTMEVRLVHNPRLVLEDAPHRLRHNFTVEGFKDWLEAYAPWAFAPTPPRHPSHSLARRSRISGRYASMMGLTTNGVAKDGGYHLARF